MACLVGCAIHLKDAVMCALAPARQLKRTSETFMETPHTIATRRTAAGHIWRVREMPYTSEIVWGVHHGCKAFLSQQCSSSSSSSSSSSVAAGHKHSASSSCTRLQRAPAHFSLPLLHTRYLDVALQATSGEEYTSGAVTSVAAALSVVVVPQAAAELYKALVGLLGLSAPE
jgi:hypothetical protein